MRQISRILNQEMVKAVLEGRKTQTRVPLKSPAKSMQKLRQDVFRRNPDNDPWYKDRIWSMRSSSGSWGDYTNSRLIEKFSPFGQPGDELYVREAIRAIELDDGNDVVEYMANGATSQPYPNTPDGGDMWRKLYNYRGKHSAIVPCIHMPKWAARLFLPVKRVWVHRIRDISSVDAIAEGVMSAVSNDDIMPGYSKLVGDAKANCVKPPIGFSPRARMDFLWEKLYPGSWERNDWVWACEFEGVS